MTQPAAVTQELRTREELSHRKARNATMSEKPKARKPKVFSASDLLTREFSPLRWAIPSLLAEGLFILAGRPKLGKSWLVLNFAIAVSSGGYALGNVHVEAGDVLYNALEDGDRRLQQRLRKALGRDRVPENLYFATEWQTFDRGGLEDLEEWLKTHPNARLVVFDTLERVRPNEDPKVRLYHNDYQAVQGLQELAKQYGICILVVHHTRKQDSNDHLDLVSGSTGLTGAADGVLILKRSRGEMDATLTANGRDFPDTELALKFDGEMCAWRAMGDAAEYRLSQERRDVLDLLRRSDPLKPKEVSVELHKDYGATKKLLHDMRVAGQINSDSKGRYSIVSVGISGNSISRAGTSYRDSNPNGNLKNGQKPAFLQGITHEGYPVTRVTELSEKREFVPPESWDEARRAEWENWPKKNAIA